MAIGDVTITAANVQLSSYQPDFDADWIPGQAGETITKFQPVYQAGSGKYLLSEAGATEDEAAAVGLAMWQAALDEWTHIVKKGRITLSGLTAKEFYVVSSTSGLIMPSSSLTTGDWVTEIGLALSSTILDVNVRVLGYQVA